MENTCKVTSAALDKALSDIGVNKDTIKLRRTTWLYMETLLSIFQKALGRDYDVKNFGSRSEGTSTEGMQSDIDFLFCYKSCLVIQDLADWQFGRLHLFMVTDMFLPPQCCCLQGVCSNNPKLTTERKISGSYMDAQGRVFLKNTVFEVNVNVDFVRHGPAQRFRGDIDWVRAFHSAKLPEDCQYIFRRPKPGHWPKSELLTELKESGVFLVPTAHVENTTHWVPHQHVGIITVRTYDNSHELYWRLSTNLMERLLMFDLNIIQMKVYVVMKMIRKEFYKPLVGDRLSTFHLKTALLYSVETSPPSIWEDTNLIKCLKICLTTVRRWFKVRYCPHYTTANVNLFSGKLQWHEFPVLVKLFTDMIHNDVSCLHNVKMDDFGYRISSYSTDSTSGLPCEKLDIVIAETSLTYLLDNVCLRNYNFDMFGAVETSKVIDAHARYIQNLEAINETKIRSVVSIVLSFHYSIQAAMKASLCIGQNQILPQDIFTLFDKALTSDVTSCRLKLASIYFSLRRFNEAVAILKQVEVLISKKVMCYSPFVTCLFDSELLKRRKEFPDILQNEIALCTIFNRHEMNCVPGHLLAEFYRTVTVEDAMDLSSWMELVVVDSGTYVYYLKYLTSRLTGLISDKHSAFVYFHNHVISMLQNYYYSCHIETSLNLLGHCYELEGELSEAWDCYCASVVIQPHNNAAYWHMFRIIGELIYGP